MFGGFCEICYIDKIDNIWYSMIANVGKYDENGAFIKRIAKRTTMLLSLAIEDCCIDAFENGFYTKSYTIETYKVFSN